MVRCRDTKQVYQIDIATGAEHPFVCHAGGIRHLGYSVRQSRRHRHDLLGTDQSTNRLVRFNSTGSVLEWFAGPGSQPTGVTSAFGALWVADWTTDLIYQVNLTTHETIFFPAPDSQVWGLTFDGRSLWTNGRDSLDRTYAVDPNTGGVVQSFDTPIVARPNNSGVAWDGHDLWIGLYEDGKLLRVDGGQPENLSVVVDQNGNPVSGGRLGGLPTRYGHGHGLQ